MGFRKVGFAFLYLRAPEKGEWKRLKLTLVLKIEKFFSNLTTLYGPHLQTVRPHYSRSWH